MHNGVIVFAFELAIWSERIVASLLPSSMSTIENDCSEERDDQAQRTQRIQQ